MTSTLARTTVGVNGYQAIDGAFVGGGWFPRVELDSDEPVLMSTWATFAGKPPTGGYLVLTDRRLIYAPRDLPGGLTPAIWPMDASWRVNVETRRRLAFTSWLMAALWTKALVLIDGGGRELEFILNDIAPAEAARLIGGQLAVLT